MSNIIDFLFETKYWPPRWYCGTWTDALGYTTISADILIFLAYFTIPCILVYFFYKVKGVEVERIFIFFALFIVFCGSTHLIDAIIFYKPIYRFSALIRVCTAIVSWLTVIQLVPYIRKIMHFPKLKVMNEALAQMLQKEREHLEVANTNLRQSQEVLEAFSYRVAHDLKEPIRGVGSYASIMLEDETLKIPEEAKAYLRKIQNLSATSQNLVNDLLEYSTLDSKKEELKLVSMEEVLNKTIEDLPDTTKPNKIKIIGALPKVYANPTTIKEVLRNLIINAVRYNDKSEKSIEIACSEKNNEYIFRFKDNGRGIPQEELSKVFSMFFRGKNAKKDGGTGLGLMIVEKVIKQHGGKVWVESEEGKGTTFYFSLPKNPSPNSATKL